MMEMSGQCFEPTRSSSGNNQTAPDVKLTLDDVSKYLDELKSTLKEEKDTGKFHDEDIDLIIEGVDLAEKKLRRSVLLSNIKEP